MKGLTADVLCQERLGTERTVTLLLEAMGGVSRQESRAVCWEKLTVTVFTSLHQTVFLIIRNLCVTERFELSLGDRFFFMFVALCDGQNKSLSG